MLNEALNIGAVLALAGAATYFSMLRYTTWPRQ